MAEMADLKQAVKRDVGRSHQAIEEIYNKVGGEDHPDQANEEKLREKEEFYRDLPLSRYATDQDPSAFLSKEYGHDDSMLGGAEMQARQLNSFMMQLDQVESKDSVITKIGPQQPRES